MTKWRSKMKKETKQKINEDVIGSLEHEGYKDDGFLRSIFEKMDRGEITLDEAKIQIKKKHGI